MKNKNYQVYGVTRSKAKSNLYNLVKLDVLQKINLVQFSNFNKKKLYSIILKIKPSEIYYLAGQSSVERSFTNPLDTYASNNLTLFYILEFCRKFNKKIKYIILLLQNVLEIIRNFFAMKKHRLLNKSLW